jgi:hypothetical protein
MLWSWPGMPDAWSYAVTTVGMMLFWILAIFGAIVIIHCLGRENRPVGRALLSRAARRVQRAAADAHPQPQE